MEKKDKRSLATKWSLVIRLLVGGYLIYTAYTLIEAIKTKNGMEQLFFIVFTALFTILGIILILMSGKSFIKGEYEGGSADDSQSNK